MARSGFTLCTVFIVSLTMAGSALAEAALTTPGDPGDVATLGTPNWTRPKAVVAFAARRVAIADSDRNGVVSSAEAQNCYATRFALMDRDRDGRLSEAEFFRVAATHSVYALDSAFEPGRLDFDSSRGTPFAKQGRGGLPTNGGDHVRRWATFDLVDGNDDGTLSWREFTDAGALDFAGSDVDGDGKVTTREFYGGKRL